MNFKLHAIDFYGKDICCFDLDRGQTDLLLVYYVFTLWQKRRKLVSPDAVHW